MHGLFDRHLQLRYRLDVMHTLPDRKHDGIYSQYQQRKLHSCTWLLQALRRERNGLRKRYLQFQCRCDVLQHVPHRWHNDCCCVERMCGLKGILRIEQFQSMREGNLQ